MYKYNIVDSGDGTDASIVIVSSEGETRTLNRTHPNFDKVYEALVFGFPDEVYASSDQDPLSDDYDESFDYEAEEEWLLERSGNVLTAVSGDLKRLSERVTFDGHNIFFDRNKVDNVVSRHLLRMLRAGDENYVGLVQFMEKLATNPSQLSRIHVYRWLSAYDFTITSDGDIVGYKAVNGTDNRSIRGGNNTVYVTVDNETVAHTGRIPNPIGAVIEIARGEVDEDRQKACSYGLHVGTHAYAKQFGGIDGNVLTVAVNPRDVVSVPQGGYDEKMRVCRYTVLEVSGVEKIEATTLEVSVPDITHIPENVIFPDDDDEGNIY